MPVGPRRIRSASWRQPNAWSGLKSSGATTMAMAKLTELVICPWLFGLVQILVDTHAINILDCNVVFGIVFDRARNILAMLERFLDLFTPILVCDLPRRPIFSFDSHAFILEKLLRV